MTTEGPKLRESWILEVINHKFQFGIVYGFNYLLG